MADIVGGNVTLDNGGWTITLPTSGSDDIRLGTAHGVLAGSWLIHYTPGGAAPSTVTPYIRVTGSNVGASDRVAPVYYNVTGDTIDAATAISTAGIYIVDASGADVFLRVTSGADGGTVYAKPVIGL